MGTGAEWERGLEGEIHVRVHRASPPTSGSHSNASPHSGHASRSPSRNACFSSTAPVPRPVARSARRSRASRARLRASTSALTVFLSSVRTRSEVLYLQSHHHGDGVRGVGRGGG